MHKSLMHKTQRPRGEMVLDNGVHSAVYRAGRFTLPLKGREGEREGSQKYRGESREMATLFDKHLPGGGRENDERGGRYLTNFMTTSSDVPLDKIEARLPISFKEKERKRETTNTR